MDDIINTVEQITDEIIEQYRREREANTPRKYAQQQTIGCWDIEFQPDHLLCDDCWELASSAFSEAVINRRYGTSTGRVIVTRGDESHGMHADVTKDTAHNG